MKAPKLPANESARLQALHDLALLDSAPEERFDRITRLAQQLFQTPVALVSLVDTDRQWFKSKQGLDACETSREISFCGHAILGEDVFYVPNALEDERFADNPLVTGGPQIRFYAGYPVTTLAGHRIGTLCIIDDKPRELSEQDFQALRDLGKCVESELGQARLKQIAETFHDQESYLRAVLDTVKDGITSLDSHGLIQTINPSTSALFGYTREELLGNNIRMLIPGTFAREFASVIQQDLVPLNGQTAVLGREVTGQRKDGSTFAIELELSELQQQSGETHFVCVLRNVEERKSAESSYRQARNRLKHFLSATPGVIFACKVDAEFTASFVSDNVSKVMGFLPGEFAKDKHFWETHIHPDDKDWVFKRLRLLLENHNLTLECRLRHADGNYRWVHARLHMLNNHLGKPLEVVGLLVDVNEQKFAQEDLKRSHHLLNAISRAQSQYISDADIHAVFDQLLLDLLQLSKSEFGFIGEVAYTIQGLPYLKTHALSKPSLDMGMFKLDSLLTEVMTTGRSVIANNLVEDHHTMENSPTTAQPLLRSFLGQPFYLGKKLIGIVGIANRTAGYDQKLIDFLQPLLRTCAQLIEALRKDMERQQTTQELNRFKHTLDQTQDMIFMFDTKTLRFEYLNNGALERMGYSYEEMRQLTPYDIKPLITKSEFHDLIRPLLDGEQSSLHFETLHRCKDGTDFPVEIFLQLVSEQNGKARFVAIVRDISERRQAEKEAALYTTALEQLHNITTNVQLDLTARINAILALGCEVFGLPMGIVSHIKATQYRVDYVVASSEAPAVGTLFDFRETYCAETLRANRPLGFHHVAESNLAGHPCYRKFALESYLGTPLYVGNELYGTLNFSSPQAREVPFTARHFSLLNQFAQWIGNELEQDRITGELFNATSLRQAILDSANFTIISSDTEGVIKAFNKGAQSLLGYREAEMVDKQTPAIIHDPNEVVARAKVLSQELGYPVEPGFEVFVAKARLGNADENEWTYIRKDGSRFPVLLSVTALRDKQNKITGFLGIASDITARKLADEALRASEQKLSSLYRMSPVAIALNRFSDGQFIEGNPELYRMVGYTEAEFRQLSYWDITPESYAELETKQLESLRERGTYGPYEKEYIHNDGHRFPVLLNGTLITGEDGQTYIWSIVQDISERVSAERELQERERYTRTIIDNVVDGIITLDRHGFIESFNAAAEQIFGRDTESVLGNNLTTLVPIPASSSTGPSVIEFLRSCLVDSGQPPREYEGLRNNGDRFHIEFLVSELSHNGENKFVAVVRDITDRKRIERMKSEFVSTVSHELRTPLTSIKGALSLILSKSAHELPPKTLAMLQTANRNSERLSLLINDILDLERIESGKMQFEFKPVDLISLAQQAVEANETYAQQHSVHLKLSLDLSTAPVWGDGHRLQQVFANLLSNAIKFSPAGDEVNISISRHRQGFRVSVKDHGRGIPEEFRPRIFQRFAQADSSDTRDKGGTGLGLSITKAIIERHGGDIDYFSQKHAVTEFYFDLPERDEIGFTADSDVETQSRKASS